MLLGTVAALLLFDLLLWEAALLAAILAPTDAALGQAGLAVQSLIVTVVSWTVLLSVFAHGRSARPAAQAYGRHVGAMGEEHAEHQPDGRRRRGLDTT